MKKIIPVFFAIAAIYFFLPSPDIANDPNPTVELTNSGNSRAADPVLRPGAQAQGNGIVVRILSDDIDGSRHQRFILRLTSGRTLLISHNIDLAPRVSGLKEGDTVSFNGEYEANSQGGVIHWTHYDPAGRHVGGWLRHNGRTYQ